MRSRPTPLARAAVGQHDEDDQIFLRVSFEFLDWETKEFFVHGFDSEFYVRLFSCLQAIQTSTAEQIAAQTHPSLTCKAIFRTATGSHDAFPSQVVARIAAKLGRQKGAVNPELEAQRAAKTAFEVSMGKNQGRLHGFLWDKAFNLVWFDPAHNLYPGGRRIRGPQDLMQLKAGSHGELLRLRSVNDALIEENEQLSRDLDELMTAWVAGDSATPPSRTSH